MMKLKVAFSKTVLLLHQCKRDLRHLGLRPKRKCLQLPQEKLERVGKHLCLALVPLFVRKGAFYIALPGATACCLSNPGSIIEWSRQCQPLVAINGFLIAGENVLE